MDDKNSRKEKGKETVADHPCALCKHQRRKCSEEDCTMWRFFPPTEGDIFVSALKKTFGISTIIEKIGKLDGIEKKAQAVFALKKEAILWKDDPVHGPSGLISRLKQEERILKQHIIRHLQLQGHNLNLDNLHVPVVHNPHVHASSSSAAGSEACAACKHQRRKCELEKCILRRFFPASETDTFLAVHEIFGVSIIKKTLQELDSFVKKDQVARAMKNEGILWRKDPVRGASGEISRLEQGNEMLKECLKALSENQRLKQENEFLKVSLENPRLKEENEFLKVQNEQLRNQLQGAPLPRLDHNTTPVEPHVLAPSAAEFENTQKGYAEDNEIYISVIENDMNLASIDPLITPEMGAGNVGSWDMIEGHSGHDTINQSTSAIVGGEYDPSRVVGMEENGRIGGNVHTGWSSGSYPNRWKSMDLKFS